MAARGAGVNVLKGDLTTENAIHNRVQTFGPDNVTFFESRRVGDHPEEHDLHFTRDQAIAYLRDRYAQWIEGGPADPYIGVKVDLTKVDMTDWEQPKITQSMR